MFVAKERLGVWRPNSPRARFAATHAEIVWGGVTTAWHNASHRFVLVFNLYSILTALRLYANGDLNFHRAGQFASRGKDPPSRTERLFAALNWSVDTLSASFSKWDHADMAARAPTNEFLCS
jgi:hypothetical protein